MRCEFMELTHSPYYSQFFQAGIMGVASWNSGKCGRPVLGKERQVNWGKGEWAKINQTVEHSVWLSLFRVTLVLPKGLGDFSGIMISKVFSNLVNCVILWFCNMEVIRQDHIVLYGTWKFSLQFVRPHPTSLCEIMRILAVWHIYKNTFSTWQIKYCKNCVFKLSECSCEVFFMYVLACSKCCPWTSVYGIIGYVRLEEASWGHLVARSVEVRVGSSGLCQSWS